MLKKILTAFLLLTFVFAPIAENVFQGPNHEVSAKSYRSGKKSFNTNSNTNNNSMFQKKSNVNKKSTATNSGAKKTNSFNKGGFMKSMLLGGMAGLLFGSLLANMGALGSVFGLVINILFIVLLVGIIKKLFTRNNNNRPRKEVNETWRR